MPSRTPTTERDSMSDVLTAKVCGGLPLWMAAIYDICLVASVTVIVMFLVYYLVFERRY